MKNNLIYSHNHFKFFENIILKKRYEIIEIIKEQITLNKINEGYSFLGDEYVFLKRDAECLSFPRAINFKKFHNKHYKLAFKYNWNSLKVSKKNTMDI